MNFPYIKHGKDQRVLTYPSSSTHALPPQRRPSKPRPTCPPRPSNCFIKTRVTSLPRQIKGPRFSTGRKVSCFPFPDEAVRGNAPPVTLVQYFQDVFGLFSSLMRCLSFFRYLCDMNPIFKLRGRGSLWSNDVNLLLRKLPLVAFDKVSHQIQKERKFCLKGVGVLKAALINFFPCRV